MNGRVLVGGALALLLVTALPASAQERQGRGGGFGQASPIAFLLEQGDSIQFNDEQKASLLALDDSLEAANAPSMEKIQELRASGGGGGGFEAMRPLMTKIRETSDAWLEKAMAVLDEGQREVAQRILDRRPRGRRGGGE